MAPAHNLSDADIDRIAMAVIEKMPRGHTCRFNDNEASIQHEFARQIDVDTLLALKFIGRIGRSVGVTVGVWTARLVVVGILVTAAAGAAFLAFLAYRDYLRP